MKTRKQELMDEFFETMGKMRSMGESLSKVSPEDRIATMLQMSALKYLKHRPNTKVSDLGKTLFMSSSSIAQFSNRLAKAGFIKRHEDKNDRRIVRLGLTKKGESELSSMHKKMREKMGKFLEMVSEKDLGELVRIQKKILKSLQAKK